MGANQRSQITMSEDEIGDYLLRSRSATITL